MLAKQGWRLMQNVDSLVARVLKAKYYGNSNFMKAQLGTKPSYTWWSILEGRQVLEKGLIWRISNDINVNIKNHPWVSNILSFKVQIIWDNFKGLE